MKCSLMIWLIFRAFISIFSAFRTIKINYFPWMEIRGFQNSFHSNSNKCYRFLTKSAYFVNLFEPTIEPCHEINLFSSITAQHSCVEPFDFIWKRVTLSMFTSADSIQIKPTTDHESNCCFLSKIVRCEMFTFHLAL